MEQHVDSVTAKKCNLTLQFKLRLFMHNCTHSFNSSGMHAFKQRKKLTVKEKKQMCMLDSMSRG